MKRLCPRCGKEIDDNNSINNFCIDCYLKEHDVIKIPKIELVLCPKCNKIKYFGKFFKNKEDIEIEKEISKHIKIKDLKQAKVICKLNLDTEKKENNYIDVSVRFLIGNKIKTIQKKERITLKKELCLTCSRLSGSYYTTILQIRFENKNIKKKLENKTIQEIKKDIDQINKIGKKEKSTIHIVKEKIQKTGIDYYLDNSIVTNRIVQHLLKYKSAYPPKYSKTLVGVDKKGIRRYRNTICVKFGNNLS